MAALLLKESEVCEQLGVGRSTIRRLMEEGALRPLKIGKSLRFPAGEVEQYVRDLQAQRPGQVGQ